MRQVVSVIPLTSGTKHAHMTMLFRQHGSRVLSCLLVVYLFFPSQDITAKGCGRRFPGFLRDLTQISVTSASQDPTGDQVDQERPLRQNSRMMGLEGCKGISASLLGLLPINSQTQNTKKRNRLELQLTPSEGNRELFLALVYQIFCTSAHRSV